MIRVEVRHANWPARRPWLAHCPACEESTSWSEWARAVRWADLHATHCYAITSWLRWDRNDPQEADGRRARSPHRASPVPSATRPPQGAQIATQQATAPQPGPSGGALATPRHERNPMNGPSPFDIGLHELAELERERDAAARHEQRRQVASDIVQQRIDAMRARAARGGKP